MDPAIAAQEVTCTDMVVYQERALALPSLEIEGSDPGQHLDVPSDTTEIDVPTDDLLAIGSGIDDDGLPPLSAFTRANDRLYRGPLLGEPVSYCECQRNQDPRVDGHAVDGCKKFVSRGSQLGNLLRCATCGCHRSYHRVETCKDVTPICMYNPATGVKVYYSHPSL